MQITTTQCDICGDCGDNVGGSDAFECAHKDNIFIAVCHTTNPVDLCDNCHREIHQLFLALSTKSEGSHAA